MFHINKYEPYVKLKFNLSESDNDYLFNSWWTNSLKYVVQWDFVSAVRYTEIIVSVRLVIRKCVHSHIHHIIGLWIKSDFL